MPGHPEGREVLQLTCVAVDFCRNPDSHVRDNIFLAFGRNHSTLSLGRCLTTRSSVQTNFSKEDSTAGQANQFRK
jgi:hypothetical protein